jgi:hypothetical protein
VYGVICEESINDDPAVPGRQSEANIIAQPNVLTHRPVRMAKSILFVNAQSPSNHALEDSIE